MGNISESAIWEATVNQIETADQLLGGPTGPMNKATKQLANRTLWLKQALQGFTGLVTVNTSRALTLAELLHNLILINASGQTLTVTLPDSGDPANPIPNGFRAVITAQFINVAQVTLQCGGSDVFKDSYFDKTTVYLGDADVLEIVWSAFGWFLMPGRGNFDCVGDVELQYHQKRNTLIAQGQLINRASYPRLWEWAQGLGPSLVDDATWATAGNLGFYSTGNGTTNFRLPDLRSMFLRGLDLGAGIDFARLSANPGGYEADEIKEHSHMTVYDGDTLNIAGHPQDAGRSISPHKPMIRYYFKSDSGGRESYELAGTLLDNTQPNSSPTSKTGGAENLVKNIGLLPLIKV